MTKKQLELLNFCGYKVNKNNKISGEKECIASMFFDEKTKLFSVAIKSYAFEPGDYDSIEMFTITVNHMLGLVYDLNHLEDVKNEE